MKVDNAKTVPSCEPEETISDAYIRYVFPDEVGFTKLVQDIENRGLESPADYYHPPGTNELLFYLGVFDNELIAVIQAAGGVETNNE